MKIGNKTKTASILFVLISFVCDAAILQPPPPPPPPGFPIDGGVLAILALGLVYGIKRKTKG